MFKQNLQLSHFALILICCVLSKTNALFNQPTNSPFNRPFQSAYSPLLGSNNNNLGFQSGYNSPALSPFSTTSFGNSNLQFKRQCPICDSSVYGYCSEKLFHDSCCCHNPNNPYDRLPFQCQYADCSFLHANSCREHKLITACCCTNYLMYRK
ncbi:hypothetical protein ABEB36_003352 [Hypothenemus hampei]|uniref:CCC domain-containing protein n=1 Tax=Hypothenemus hampei TaxID=57062 RepID=A0ABD1FBH0_HYPHA